MKRMASLLIVTLISSVVAYSGQLTREEKRTIELEPAVVLLVVSVKVDVRFMGLPIPLQHPNLVTVGNGFIIRPDGYIITNGIVMRNALLNPAQLEEQLAGHVKTYVISSLEEQLKRPLSSEQKMLVYKSAISVLYATPAVEVYLANGRHFSGELIQYSGEIGTGADVAIVRIRADNLPTVPVGDSDTVRVPDPVTVIGYPGILWSESPFVPAITAGRISATRMLPGPIPQVFESDAVTHSNNGGPVFNQNGQVIGIAAARVADTVVPINVAMQLLKNIGVTQESGEFNRHWTRALDLYDARKCGASIEEFDSTLSFVPDLPVAKRLRAGAVTCLDTAGGFQRLLDSPGLPWKLLALIGLAIVLLGLAVLLLMKWRRTGPEIRTISGRLYGIAFGALDFLPRLMSQGKDRMAIGMAIVAVMGAAAAYCAARVEQDAVPFESELDQGQMVELSLLQSHQDALVSRHRLGDQGYAYINTRHDPKADKWYAGLNEMTSFLNYIGGDRPDQSDCEQLKALGFHTVCTLPNKLPGNPTSIWDGLKHDIRAEKQRLIRLVASLVVFVLALVFLTFAQLTHERPQRKLLLTRLGCVTALMGLAYAGWHDTDSWKTFRWFVIATPVLLFLGWVLAASEDDWESIRTSSRLGAYILGFENRVPLFSFLFRKVKRTAEWSRNYLQVDEVEDKPAKDEAGELEELDRPRHPGLRIPLAPVSHRFGRTVVYLIAGTAFLSALYGLIYTEMIISSETFASNALDYQVERSNTTSLHRADAVMHLEELISVWRCIGPAGTNQGDAEPTRQNFSGDDLDQANPELKRCLGTIPPERVKLLETDLGGPQGPDQDPEFPKQLLLPTLLKESEMLFATADGEKDISFAWRRRATAFLRSLTLFAISLYLFGQALGLGATRSGFMLLFYATALALVGAFSPVMLSRHDYRSPDEKKVFSAAEHYAAGRTFYETHKYTEARNEFQAAYSERPTFVLAGNYVAATSQILEQAQNSLPELRDHRSTESVPK
jgi:S1-C subfamily serine protease